MAANTIVVPEFGTAVRQKWWTRLRNLRRNMMSDNTMITVYPFNGSLYTFYESPHLHRLDADLNTVGAENLTRLNLLSHASHPHYDEQGNMITMGLGLGLFGPKYKITKFIKTNPPELLTDCSRKQVSKTCSKTFNPSYMHSFSVTENFYVLIEQPLSVSVTKAASAMIKGRPLSSALSWDGNTDVKFHLINKKTGRKFPIKFVSKAFFFLHTINAYEEADHMVVDICCYDSPAMMDLMFIEKLQTAQTDKNYAPLFRGRPKRFVLPLKPVPPYHHDQVTIKRADACAHFIDDNTMVVEPSLIADVGCETPAINYEMVNGKSYRYFYAITSDVDADNAGKLMKVDTWSGHVSTWQEDNVYCSEPVFLPRPGAREEDDGVLVFSIIWGKPHVNKTGIVFVEASNLETISRVHFNLSGPVPKPLHGCFVSSWDFVND